jgi:hypothetical protein
MLQCQDCEFFRQGPDGSPELTCNPFTTVKEPECLAKWQLVQLTVIAKSHQATLDMYRRLAPLQEKMFKHMEREIDDADDADRWKYGDDEEEDDNSFRV